MITKKDIRNSLLKVGLKKDMTVLISSSLISLGPASTKNYYKNFLDEIRKIIGKKGTICVNSYTTDIVRYNKLYKKFKSPSNSGGFENFLKKQKLSFTSDHPAHSVTSLGYNAKYICINNGLNNYDLNSPYFKLLNLKAKILRIGLGYESNVYTHIAEALCGAPYFYCKWLKVKIGRNRFKYYTMYVRHLGYNLEFDKKKLKSDIFFNKKMIRSSKLGTGYVHLMDANQYFDFIKKKLLKNPHYLLLKMPKYKKGVIPYDGPSKKRDGI